jgi:hypothetical protein
MSKPDWDSIYIALREETWPAVREFVNVWLASNPDWRANCMLINYPPRISVTLQLDSDVDKRRKESYIASPPAILELRDEELDPLTDLATQIVQDLDLGCRKSIYKGLVQYTFWRKIERDKCHVQS